MRASTTASGPASLAVALLALALPAPALAATAQTATAQAQVLENIQYAVLLDMTDGIGAIAQSSSYFEIGADGVPTRLEESPVSGLSC